MNAFVRPSRSAWLTFDEIEVSDNARPYNASDVVTLAKSIREIGLMTPLSVVERDGRFVLVAGRHRLEALKLDGSREDSLPRRRTSTTSRRGCGRSAEFAPHRTDRSQRAKQIAEWVKLTAEKVAQVDALGRRAPADKGILPRP